MFYHQTIFEYIDNPMGKGSTAIANRGLIRENLNQRYDKLVKKHGEFKCNRFFDGQKFYYHILIPSETERNNTYDVMIELSDPTNDFTKDITLNRYVMRVFSNCPSFTYTYAYTFDSYGMLIEGLKYKYNDIVFEQAPNTKNPGNIINYEKSIYFACRFLSNHKTMLNKISLATTNSIGLEREFKKIRNMDNIMLEIKHEEQRISAEKKGKPRPHKPPKKDDKPQNRVMPKAKATGDRRVKPVGKISKIKPSKKTVKK